MIRKIVYMIFMVFLITGCIKETYDMDMLSGKVKLNPAMVFSAVRGDVSLSDLVESDDTIVFDQDNFVKIVFKEDSLFNFIITDFHSITSKNEQKGKNKSFGQLVATVEPETYNLEIEDILRNISGDFIISNPTVRLNYSNSFSYPVKMKLDATGKSLDKTPVNLELDTFALSMTNTADQPNILESITIDNSNSRLAEILSMPPEEILFSGSAIMDTLGIVDQKDSYLTSDGLIIGSLELEVPLEFRMNNLQFTDTVDNFLSDTFEEDSDFTWDDFESLSIYLNAENEFPLGASVTLNLYDSLNHMIISSIDAEDILKPADVDINGKANGATVTSTKIEMTEDFIGLIDNATNIIFRFTLNTTGNGLTDVKIYSDYRIDFSANLAIKTDINIYLK